MHNFPCKTPQLAVIPKPSIKTGHLTQPKVSSITDDNPYQPEEPTDNQPILSASTSDAANDDVTLYESTIEDNLSIDSEEEQDQIIQQYGMHSSLPFIHSQDQFDHFQV